MSYDDMKTYHYRKIDELLSTKSEGMTGSASYTTGTGYVIPTSTSFNGKGIMLNIEWLDSSNNHYAYTVSFNATETNADFTYTYSVGSDTVSIDHTISDGYYTINISSADNTKSMKYTIISFA